MLKEIEYEISRDDYTAALRKFQLRLRRLAKGDILFVILLVLIFFTSFFTSHIVFAAATDHSGPLLWLFITIAFLIYLSKLRKANTIYNKMISDDGVILGPHRLVCLEEGFRLYHRHGENFVAWSGVKEIERDERNVFIYVDNAAFYNIPIRAFASEKELEEFINLLLTRSGMAAERSTFEQEAAEERETYEAGLPDMADPLPFILKNFLHGIGQNIRSGLRVAFFQRVRLYDFEATGDHLIALFLINILLGFLLCLAYVGTNGYFSYYDIPVVLFGIIPLLLISYVIARVEAKPALAIALPIAFLAAGLPIGIINTFIFLLKKQSLLPVFNYKAEMFLHYSPYIWWLVCSYVCIYRLARRINYKRIMTVSFLLIMVLPVWYVPSGQLWRENYTYDEDNDFFGLYKEDNFYAQADLLEKSMKELKPERDGVIDLYFVGLAGESDENVFMNEVKTFGSLFERRFDTEGRSVMLINNLKTLKEKAIASKTSLEKVLSHVGRTINRDEDILFLYLTSHGSSKRGLSIDFYPLDLNSLSAPDLKGILARSEIKWKVIVVSACYSGTFVDTLKDENTLVITASDAHNSSYGCGKASEFTYFGDAYFNKALDRTYSFEEAFENASMAIRNREKKENKTFSNPQMYIGSAIREHLDRFRLQMEKQAAF